MGRGSERVKYVGTVGEGGCSGRGNYVGAVGEACR